ncbi:MAG TPA: 16S rRNA (cytosine(967)-C(5))-methyltransferase RsmB [Gammaproteobacteria bacterium]|jgi:16S rRNA (cytosine967-C5)-methyltransferase|nr:16S rRNA (cytosine(967)-C(5))-methyltransferase RsmB [Gammaproteobacteria bacterium]
MTSNLRLLAAHVINAVTDGQSLADCLPPQLAKIKDHRDKAFVQALSYGVCRFYPRLDVILSHLMTKPMKAKDSDVHALMMAGIYQLMDMHTPEHAAVSETVNAVEGLKKPWARGLVNAVLREYLRQKDKLQQVIDADEEAAYAHPLWWIAAVRKAWPEQWQEVLHANNIHPPFSLRVNQQHGDAADYIKLLNDHDLAASLIQNTRQGIILDKPIPAEQLPGFSEGKVTVQDGAAQLAANLMQLEKGQNILDACAAPGGKLTHILEIEPTVNVTAVEKDESRIKSISENLQRLNQQAELICADAGNISSWWNGKPFDRILLDAPCSASGVIRRHPDIKLLRQSADIRSLASEQTRILDGLWEALALNGLLVYATCSVFPEENSNIIEKFLSTHPDAKEEIIDSDWGVKCKHGRQILPGMDNMDGFYYAIIRKA